MDCEDGVWTYRPRPRNTEPRPEPQPAASTAPTSSTLNEQLLEGGVEKPTLAINETDPASQDVDRKGLILSLLALLLSIPALIGAWCWPALVIGVVSGTVSASSRTMGHTISLYITAGLMLLVAGVLGREACIGPRSWAPPKTRWGPLCVLLVGATLIMVEPTRHVLTDANTWPWCGNNPSFDRVNSTDPYPDQCLWSATQYVCTQVCCVSTWQPTDPKSPATSAYSWLPPSADFYPDGPLPGPFATLRPDGSIYFPDQKAARMPYQLYEASATSPLAFYETGALNPLRAANPVDAATCPYGLNNASGYCFLTNQSLSYDEQLAQLGTLADPTKPHNATSNPYVCGCDGCVPDENFFHLSVVGVLSTIVCTYAGFALLAFAVAWNANLLAKLGKIRKQWNELRGQTTVPR